MDLEQVHKEISLWLTKYDLSDVDLVRILKKKNIRLGLCMRYLVRYRKLSICEAEAVVASAGCYEDSIQASSNLTNRAADILDYLNDN